MWYVIVLYYDYINVITISTVFQFNRSGLESKQTVVIDFFPIWTTKTIELKFFWIEMGWVLWVSEQR